MTRRAASIAITVISLSVCLLWPDPAAAQTATLSTTSVAFGNVGVGNTAVRALQITNNGTSNLIISNIAASANFQASSCGNDTVIPNGSCTMSLSFTPSTAGSSTGTVTITDNAPNSPQVISLGGTGVPAVAFTPASLTFLNQAVGTASMAKTITLTNNQSASLNITSVSATGGFAVSSCPATLAPEGSCVISVTFTPPALGTSTGTLTVTDSATNSPQTASLTGTGVQPVTFSQTGITFLNQVVNTTSTSKTLILTNNQSTPLNISSITTASSFAATSCPASIVAYGTCNINVTFTPASATSFNGTLTVVDSTNTSPQTVSLSGTGIQGVFLTPTTLQFPSQALQSTSAVQTMILSNPLSVAVSVTSVSATAPFAASGCVGTVAPGGNCTMSVTFTPTVAGNNSGTLTVTDSAAGSPQTATLRGVGSSVQLNSITVTPATPSIALGTTEQFTATGNYSNGSTSNITSSVTWNSAAANVATVTAAGLASTVAAGSSTITATSGAISGSTTLTVTPPTLVSIAVTPSNPSIASGTTQQYTATGTYTDGSTNNLTSSVTWSSSNTATATITSGGLVTGIGVASATITATSGSISGSATVNITPAVLTTITVTPLNPSAPAGTTQQFMATGTFTDGSTQNLSSTATWSSSSNAIATIGSTGLAQTVIQGTVTISASLGSVTGTDNLTVTAAVLTSITVNPENPSIPLGTTQQFTATGTFSDGSTQNLTTTATWTPAVASVASINSAGLATSASTGTTGIAATMGAISGSTSLTVTSAALVSIAVSPNSASVGLNSTQQFTAAGTYTDGSTQDLTTITYWTSSASGVATISDAAGSQGLATTGNGLGSTTITATVGTISGTATLRIVPSATLVSITIAPSTPSIPLGTSQQFTATGNYSDGSIHDLTALATWSSSAATVAPINSTGLASSASQGSTTILATSGTVSGSTILTVGPATLVSVAITPANASVALGLSVQFTATGTFTDGTQQNLTATATWTSSTTSATIGSSGLASTSALGATTITATSGTVSGQTTLTVVPTPSVSLSTTAISFGNVGVNATATQPLIITNTGAGNLVIAGITSSAGFQSSNCVNVTLPTSGSCTVSVSFTPTAMATSTGLLTISDNALNSPQVVSLSGAGVQPVTISAAFLTFSLQTVNTTSPPQNLKVTNNQSAPLNISSITATGPFTASSCSTPIPSNGYCIFSVTFSPTTTGYLTGTVSVSDDANTSPQTVSLSGNAGLSVALLPTIAAFPNQVVGSTSAPITETLFNNQSSALTGISVTITGPFAATTTCPASIPPGGTCAINVTYTPTAVYQASGVLTVVDSASDSPQTATLRGTGTQVQLNTITVTPATQSIAAGSTQAFTATGTYNNGSTANLTNSATWSSLVTTIATVNSAGIATGVGVGTSAITATSGSVSGSASLSVTPPHLASLAVTPSNFTVSPSSTQQYTATGTYTDGSTQNLTSSVTWGSGNAAVATVSASGLVRGVTNGSTTITATLGSVSGTTALTIGIPAALVSIAVTPAATTVPLNTNEQFTATGTFSDGSTQNLTESALTWSLSGVGAGTINSSGLYTAPAAVPNPAQVTITATSPGAPSVSGSITLTVVQVTVAVSPTTAQVPGGVTEQFNATVTGPTNTAVTWSAGGVLGGNSTVGTISSLGVYTAPNTVPNPAQVTITATSAADGVTSASGTVTVSPPISVTISPSQNAQVAETLTQQFTATVTGTSNTTVIWSVSGLVGGNAIIGTISPSGLYTAPPFSPYPSLLTVTATSVADPTKSATGSVRVTPPVNVVSVTISPVTLWAHTGESWQYFVDVLGSSNYAATWTVNGVVGGNTTYGTISTNGLYTAPSAIPAQLPVVVTATSMADPTKSANSNVTIANTTFSATPLIDFFLTPGQLYLGQFSGLLYNGSNSPPADHNAAGLAAAAQVQPLDANGNPSPTGKIVLASLGMSETQDDWCFGITYCTTNSFMGQAAVSNAVNHTTLTIVDGANSGANSATWICANGNCPSDSSYTNKYDYVLSNALTPAGVTEAQVQAVWIQEADLNPTYSPTLPSPSADAYNFEYLMGQTVRALKVRWPNVKQVFFSSRLYAGYTTTDQSPEPYAHEYGYGVKWLINAQIVQRETGYVDPIAGDLITNCPWIAWGPYLWGNADNNLPGSLALSWVPSDFVTSDEMHPSPAGVSQVAGSLLNYFLTSPYTQWFRQ